MRLKRLFARADVYFFRRALPHGIISWHYLLPFPTPKARIHRNLWLRSRHHRLPFALFFLIEFMLWLRWVLYACWSNSWRAVAHRGRAIAVQEGISRTAQLGHLLRLGLCHCIPPAEAYAFRLYHPESKQKLWDYVFIHEIQAFHRWRGARAGEKPKSLAILQDKFRLAGFLGARGVPMAPVLAMTPRGETFDPEPYLRTRSRIFCKPRHGSASRDAFVIEGVGDVIGVCAVKSGMKAQPSSLDCLKKAMAGDDFLIQPFLENYPGFADLSPAEDVITLRVITDSHPARGLECYCATMEIPDVSDSVLKGHIILPIEPSSGRITPFPRHLPPEVRARHDTVYYRIGNRAVPFWDTIMESAIRAHQCFTDVRAIAWDYAITPNGPVMLEGNTGWGATTPQMLHGGLLQDETVTG